MKYTEFTLWEAVGAIIPSFSVARTRGVKLSLPQCLTACAVEILTHDIEPTSNEVKSIKAALIDINHGQLIFS